MSRIFFGLLTALVCVYANGPFLIRFEEDEDGPLHSNRTRSFPNDDGSSNLTASDELYSLRSDDELDDWEQTSAVANYQFSNFMRNCVPDSLINHVSGATITLSTSDGQVWSDQARLGMFHKRVAEFVNLPVALGRYFLEQLVLAGGSRTLSNCTSAMINERLPYLDLHMSGGLIRLLPSDLFHQFSENNTCVSRFLCLEGRPIEIDALRIPNVRSWNDPPYFFSAMY